MIPEAAVQAAMEAFLLESIKHKGELGEKPFALLAALEAAAPHMLAAAYDLGIQHGANQPPNPYRARADQVTSSEETQNA